MLIFLYFKFIFFGIFELLESMCHTTRAVGQTRKEKEKLFLVFFETECHAVRATGQTQ